MFKRIFYQYVIMVVMAFAASSAMALDETAMCKTQKQDLLAGQTIDVGTVTIANDADYLYVRYELDDVDFPDATLGTTHLWIGNEEGYNAIIDDGKRPHTTPSNKAAAAWYGASDNSAVVNEFVSEQDDVNNKYIEYKIPLTDIAATTTCGSVLYISAHAEVDTNGSAAGGSETAYGGPQDDDWKNGYWMIYEIGCCDDNPPGPIGHTCETAFAYGSHILASAVNRGKKSNNPDGLFDLGITKRWGWAANQGIGETEYPVYAGAGLNDTSKGDLVGSVTINVEDAGINGDGVQLFDVTIAYDIDDSTDLTKLHIYAGDAEPTTAAPGQYGWTISPDSNEYSHTFTVADTDMDGMVWVIAHADVCSADDTAGRQATTSDLASLGGGGSTPLFFLPLFLLFGLARYGLIIQK